MRNKPEKILLILVFITLFNMTASGQVQIIAHRGASFLAPENTLASANLAWEIGSDAVECDIWLSKDNRIIICHDASTKRTTGKNYLISKTDSRILRELDAGFYKEEKYKGEKLPLLEELIETVPEGKQLVIEIKCKNEIFPFLKKVIEENRGKKDLSFICFDFGTICEAKQVFPANSCYWLCSNTIQLKSNFDKVATAKLDGVSLHFSIINKGVMEKAKNLGLEVYAWTVDNPEEAKKLIELGVKGITTNRPGWLREQIF